MSKIIVFGGGGRAGRAVTTAALARGHQVTAVVRDPARHADVAATGVDLVAGDITDAARIAEVSPGHDAAVHAVSPISVGQSLDGLDPQFYVRAVDALLSGLSTAGVGRLLVVGYAGNLETADGRLVNDTPGIFEQFRSFGVAHTAGLAALRASETGIDWLMLTPPIGLDPDGPATSRYRIGGDEAPPAGSAAEHVSYADFAAALVHQIEAPTHHRTRISVTG